MDVAQERSEAFGESFTRAHCSGGLTFYYMPRPGFTKKVALLSVRMGSTHAAFAETAGGPVHRVPWGTAHFLEHRAFQTEQGDAFHLFERLGASSNAGTSHTNTTYFFSCTENFFECLDILLGFIDRLHITDEMVDRERKIIVQEILSYADAPDWQGYLSFLRGLYTTHPVREDISGTVESVGQIDRTVLERCHRSFYHPANTVLVVAGDLGEQELLDYMARREEKPRPGAPPVPVPGPPDDRVSARYTRRFMPVPRPHFFFGFRECPPPLEGEARILRNLTTNLFLYVLFGHASDFYRHHYREGLIDDTFASAFRGERDFAYTTFTAETHEPERLRDALLRCMAETREKGIDPADVARAVRRVQGRFFRAFNSPEAAASSLLSYALRGVSLFAFPDLLGSITPEMVMQRFTEHFVPSLSSTCVVAPEGSHSS
jgi:predicted Zn-dependent peptidase